jgi:hypothetical protein
LKVPISGTPEIGGASRNDKLVPSVRVEISILDSYQRFALQRGNHGANLARSRRNAPRRAGLSRSGRSDEVCAMSSKNLRLALVAGFAVASAALVAGANMASAQNRADRWTFGPAYGPGGAYGMVPPGVYGDYSGPPIFVPGRGIINEPCGLPTSACSNAERGAD